ncbi:amino acid ABC transporter permease [Bradyrhizobium sp. CCGUVB23]|uniref:amino acid ABC transporter permease n=1 Tax=Bradyrhizobium sp. CCGUVB23 TaxID=2949630 RepID=UPI0020B444DF|nr:amino acid ABC transporter permease [Bradyrhizobium sp. CCGUVB23]MCP3463531.1 amino acid ABC transporter permease [Bradyrhizobium sp. CCGUVB23]
MILASNLSYLLEAAVVTLALSIASAILAAIIGVAIALLQIFGNVAARSLARLYLYVVRGVPLLVLLFAMYYILPYAGINLSPLLGGIFVIAIYYAAFMAEVIRAAIIAVPRGQWDAARAVGMRPSLMLLTVIFPQAVRLAGPPLINTCIMLIKGTSLVSVIGIWELTMAGRQVVERTASVFQIFGGVAAIYFFICYGLSLYGRHLERRLRYEH